MIRKRQQKGLTSKNGRTIKAAMVALDQMDGGGLDPKFVAGLLASADPGKKETASWIIGRHPNWASELAGVLGERLRGIDLSLADCTDLECQLGRFAQAAPIQQLLAARLRDAFAVSPSRRSSLQAMAWSNLKANAVPNEWVDAIGWSAGGRPRLPELVGPAVATLRALPLTKEKAGLLPDRLLRIAGDPKNPVELRLPGPRRHSRWRGQTRSSSRRLPRQRARPRSAGRVRTTAADAPARAKLTNDQLMTPCRSAAHRRTDRGRPAPRRFRTIHRHSTRAQIR